MSFLYVDIHGFVRSQPNSRIHLIGSCTTKKPLFKELAATDMRETKEAIRIAQAKLAPTARLIAGKAATALFVSSMNVRRSSQNTKRLQLRWVPPKKKTLRVCLVFENVSITMCTSIFHHLLYLLFSIMSPNSGRSARQVCCRVMQRKRWKSFKAGQKVRRHLWTRPVFEKLRAQALAEVDQDAGSAESG